MRTSSKDELIRLAVGLHMAYEGRIGIRDDLQSFVPEKSSRYWFYLMKRSRLGRYGLRHQKLSGQEKGK